MQHHWKDVRGEREDDIAGTTGEKPRKLGHLTYRDGKPIPGLCYCPQDAAHDAEDAPAGSLNLLASKLGGDL